MPQPNRNLFRLTRFILLRLPFLLKVLAIVKPRRKRLLLIKTDAIGDYILFRNFLEVLKNDEHYRDYQITLLGNKLWKDISQKYDGRFIDKFIYTSADNLYHSPIAVLKLGWQLFCNNYQVVLQPAYTRTLMNDGFAGLAAAKKTIGFTSDNERIIVKYKNITDKFYSERLLLPVTSNFEFERNKFFFQSFLQKEIPLMQPSIPFTEKPRQGIVLVPSAGLPKRRWELNRFTELIKRIANNTTETIYLEGSPVGQELEAELASYIEQGRIVNLIGKTSLLQLIDLISGAALVVANETGPVQIAAATGTKVICIAGGGHFGRFVPYPAHLANGPICVYHPMDCFNCNWVCIYETVDTEPYPCVSNVNLDAVWAEVNKHL